LTTRRLKFLPPRRGKTKMGVIMLVHTVHNQEGVNR
jgi:hypothetical protein